MRTKLMLIALLGLAILPCAGQSSGQGGKAGTPVLDKLDFGLTYTDKYAKITNTTGTYFNLPGGSLDVAYNLQKFHGLAIAADFQGETATKPITLGIGLNQISYVFGPRYTVWEQKRVEHKANIYVEALFGGMHAWDSYFQQTPTSVGTTSASSIDSQAKTLSRLMPLSDLQDPKKLTRLVERFTAMYDLDYGPSSGATTSLTVSSGNTGSGASSAVSILSNVITANGQTIASALNAFTGATPSTFSSGLMASLAKLNLGG